jgi:stearoyl-CoA desaturase (delta-9 desaturase)
MSVAAHRVNAAFIAAVHLIALGGLGWAAVDPPVWPTLALAFTWYWCSGLSITGGYHRLFAHRSYKCAPVVSLFYLLFGAAAVQNSALTWASDHRRHHAHTDAEGDPYDARRGLWWSHIGWVLREDPLRDYSNVRDLQADPLVSLQHRFYLPIAVVMGAVLPALVAWTWRDPFGGLLWAGCIRLVAQYHSTFAINSLAHRFGRQPFDAHSARDNALVALVTMGEGYHNFHHRFPTDYRNGIRRTDFDPTKWLVRTLAAFGLTSDLKRAPAEAIARARSGRAESS